MNYKKRSRAIIFNHYQFNNMSPRDGTNKDRHILESVFKNLGFRVKVYNDESAADVKRILVKESKRDHSNRACIVIIVLSHGDGGNIWASDKLYPATSLWEHFKTCPTLVGKPKLFFIQACRGDVRDRGFPVESEKVIALNSTSNTSDTSATKTSSDVNGVPLHFFLPTTPDLLIMYATSENNPAWRNENDGTWFIQALCDELKINGKKVNLLTMLTSVSRDVAQNRISKVPGKPIDDKNKQMPCIVTMLTKNFYFLKEDQ